MTFSIVARSADGRSWGVAVASKYLAAAAAVSAARAGAGALATQSFVNLAYKRQGLDLLAQGRPAAEVVAVLTGADDGAAGRQLGVVDASGGSATFTGADCMDWAGGVHGDGYAIQGNLLAGPQVVEAMERAWLASDPAAALAYRLVEALAAGDAAGGDRRGRQSAGVLVAAQGWLDQHGDDHEVDLRVDDHPQATEELARLIGLHQLYFGAPDPASVLPLTGDLAGEVTTMVTALGFADLDGWAGMENYEYRLVPGGIDPLVLGKLREAYSAAHAAGTVA